MWPTQLTLTSTAQIQPISPMMTPPTVGDGFALLNFSDQDKPWPIFLGKSQSKSVKTYPCKYDILNQKRSNCFCWTSFWASTEIHFIRKKHIFWSYDPVDIFTTPTLSISVPEPSMLFTIPSVTAKSPTGWLVFASTINGMLVPHEASCRCI